MGLKKAIYTLLAGDWNDPPDARGPYSSKWLDFETGMEVYDPVHGKHGRIDHIHSDAAVHDVERIPGGGSDHGLLKFKVTVGGFTYIALCWNVERDRTKDEREEMVDFLGNLCVRHEPHFILLQEVKQYHGIFKNFPGYKFYGSLSLKKGHNIILVRDDVPVTNFRVVRLSSIGWRTAAGPMHAPIYSPFVVLDGVLDVGCIHMVVGVDCLPDGPVGPPARVKVWIQSMRKLKSIAKVNATRRKK